MSIKDEFKVDTVSKIDARKWIINKHYAHRMPSVSYAFGLFKKGKLVGVCTFGITFNYAEDNVWGEYTVYELNRLITKDNLPRNSLSYFVGGVLKKMYKPSVIISYADDEQGHKGYIYQATNWIYTGKGGNGKKIYVLKNGKRIHQRSVENYQKIKNNIKKTIITKGKHRYYYFLGNKKQKNEMLNILKNRKYMQIQPYPKGKNKEYDIGNDVTEQQRLFQ